MLRLELDLSKVLDVAGRIAENFLTDLFVIWSEDNAEKVVIRCRILGTADKDEDGLGTVEEDIFLWQLEKIMLNSVSLRGVKCIGRVFLLEHDKVIINDEASPTAVQVHRYQAAKRYSHVWSSRDW